MSELLHLPLNAQLVLCLLTLPVVLITICPIIARVLDLLMQALLAIVGLLPALLLLLQVESAELSLLAHLLAHDLLLLALLSLVQAVDHRLQQADDLVEVLASAQLPLGAQTHLA